jgi:threonine/homoserine/homoserine lactone efflux protein
VDTSFLVRGLLIGFSIAMPVGPIGLLCLQRTLLRGRLVGLVTGLGAATADALYGTIAGLGLTFISSFLVSQQGWLRFFGGLFLCYLGIRTLVHLGMQNWDPGAPGDPALQNPKSKIQNRDLIGAYGSTVVLTLANPLTILSFVAVFAGLGVGGAAGNYATAVLLVAGVFLGSACWWLILSSGAALLRTRLAPRHLGWASRASGVLILGFGLLALASLL